MVNWGKERLWLLSEKARGRQSSGWNPSFPSPKEDLLFGFGFLRNSKIIMRGKPVSVFMAAVVSEPPATSPSPCSLPHMGSAFYPRSIVYLSGGSYLKAVIFEF